VNTISNNSVADVNSVELSGKERVNKVEEQKIQQDVNTAKAKIQEDVKAEKEPKADISHKQMEMVAQQLQDFVGKMNKGLEFSVHQDSGRDVIKVIDKNNGDLIKQYPSEEVLDLVSKLSHAAGSFVNEKV
jgi:flagellar protein FlaG